MYAPSTKPLDLIGEMELLHAGIGVLMAHYLACHDDAVRHCIALRISRQLRIIAEHQELPDRGLRPIYRTMAARWQVHAIQKLPCLRRPASSPSTSDKTLFEETV